MSGAVVEFYLDFISPFGYLARHAFSRVAQQYGCVVHYHAIDLNRIKIAAGNTGPSNRNIPPKIRYLTTDLQRWAQRYGTPMVERLPGPDTARVNKGLLLASDRFVADDYVKRTWDCIWRDGLDPGLESTLDALARSMDWDPADFRRFVDSEEAAMRYDEEGRLAIERGVFGVPTFIVDGQMYWGNDRLDFLAEYLAQRKPA